MARKRPISWVSQFDWPDFAFLSSAVLKKWPGFCDLFAL
jgi:hypothetical protein